MKTTTTKRIVDLAASLKKRAQSTPHIFRSKHNPLAHGVRIAITDEELAADQRFHHFDYGNAV